MSPYRTSPELTLAFVLVVLAVVTHELRWHRLDVELRRNKGELRARPGYFLREQLFSK